MTSRRTRRTAVQAAAFAAAATAITIAACETPHPTAPRPDARPLLTKITAASGEIAITGRPLEEKVREVLAQRYPAVLQARTGHQQRVWLVADSTGAVVQSAWQRPDDSAAAGGVPSLDPSAIATVDVMKLAPGRLGPDSVAVVWIALKAARSSAPFTMRGDGAQVSGDRVTRIGGGATGPTVTVADAVVGRVRLRAATDAASADSTKPTPVFFVDGRETSAEAVHAMAPDGIASVEVLKGQAAIDVYGEKARNGVVRITTKGAGQTARSY